VAPRVDLSILVPTFNRREQLARLLRSLESQRLSDGGQFEVVVAVDGSTDGTVEMLADFKTSYPLTVLPAPNGGPSVARNRALSKAIGDVVLFLDDDVVPSDDLLERHLVWHRAEPDVVVIGALLQPKSGASTPWARWEAVTLMKHYDALVQKRKPVTPHHFYTGNGSVRREHALAIGGFDESFRRGEDVELAYRLEEKGLKFRFDLHASVEHETDHALKKWLNVPYQYGHKDVLMAREHGRPQALQTQYANPGNLVIRLITQLCVGHPVRHRLVFGLGTFLLGRFGELMPAPLQRAFCSTLFSLQYWQGVADATGLGAAALRSPERLKVLSAST
jgi:glycosyltransferase involved in cell wall biosynthesis